MGLVKDHIGMFTEDIRGVGAFFRSNWRWGIALMFLSTLLFTIASFSQLASAFGRTDHGLTEVEQIESYALLVTRTGFIEWCVGVLSVLAILLWPFLVWVGWVMTMAVTEIIFQFYAKASAQETLRRRRYNRALKRALRREFLILQSLVIIACTIILILSGYWRHPITYAITVYVTLLICCTIILYTIVWTILLIIRRKRLKSGKDIITLSRHLFSNDSMRRSFKNSVDILVFLGVLGLLILPVLFATTQAIEQKGAYVLIHGSEYGVIRDALGEHGYSTSNAPTAMSLPDPELLASKLSVFSEVFSYSDLESSVVQFQRGLFAIVTLVLLFQVGVPSILRVIIYETQRSAYVSIVKATIWTFIFVLIIQVIVQKAYFIDLGKPFGVGTLFSFVLSYNLMRETKNVELPDVEGRGVRQSPISTR